MILLHALKSPTRTALVWFKIEGANGRVLGPGATWFSRHAFRLTRKMDPPPIGDGQRAYWDPWRIQGFMTREDVLTPICGRINSKSQWPRLRETWADYRDGCRDCIKVADQKIVFMGDLRQTDIWYKIVDKRNMIDPISEK